MQDITFKTTINNEVLSQEVVIDTEDQYKQAGDVLKLCKDKVKEVDTERKNFTKPLDESKKRIMSKAKEIIEPIKEYIDKVESAMGGWYVQEEAKRKEEQKKLEEKAIEEAGDNPDVVVPVVESVKKTKGSLSTSSVIEYNDYEVVDETKVPREYLKLDETKIKQAVKIGTQIEGIKIIKKTRIMSR